jgi:antirestriction protein ArdC
MNSTAKRSWLRRWEPHRAAYLCTIAGIANEHTDRNTTAYIQSWITRLEEDNRLIVQAAANAQKAVDLIAGLTFEEEITEETGDA